MNHVKKPDCLIEVTQATPFTVNYNSNVANTDGQLTLVIVKLER